MGESPGQSFVVENRPGATGIIGTDLVAKSAPDGYTLLISTNALTTSPWLYSKIPLHAERELAPISIAGYGNSVLAVHNSLSVKTVKELITLAKARPSQLVIAASGAGQPLHLSGELFKQMAGVNLVTVQYKGTGAALADLAGGHVMVAFNSMAGLQPLLESGRLRALGVSGAKRLAAMPPIPAVAETLLGFDVTVWYGVLAPSRTPREVISRLHAEMLQALGHDDVRQRLVAQGFEAADNTPAEFEAVIRADLARWQKLIRDGNIRVE